MPLPKINVTKRKTEGTYRDFRKDFAVNPVTNDLAVKVDEDAVRDALRNLVLTDKGERLMQPDLGSDVRGSLFDLATPTALVILKQAVEDCINNYEPRVSLTGVEVVSIYDDNKIKITVRFYVKNREQEQTTSFFLERVR